MKKIQVGTTRRGQASWALVVGFVGIMVGTGGHWLLSLLGAVLAAAVVFAVEPHLPRAPWEQPRRKPDSRRGRRGLF